MKIVWRGLYLFLMIPFFMLVVDFFWWFYTNHQITGTDWDQFPRIIIMLCSTYAGGLLFSVIENV